MFSHMILIFPQLLLQCLNCHILRHVLEKQTEISCRFGFVVDIMLSPDLLMLSRNK